MNRTKRTATAVLAAATLGLAACGTQDAPAPATPASTAAAPAAAPAVAVDPMAECSPVNRGAGSPELWAAYDTLPPNPAVRLVRTQSVVHSDDRSKVAAIFYLCAPGLQGKDLKDYATELARAVKPTPFAQTIKSMSVYNFVGQATVGKVRVKDFQVNTFSPTADPGAVRASWQDLPN